MRHPGVGRLFLLPITLFALAACGEPGSDAGGGDGSSTSYRGTWQLVSGRGPDGEVPLVEDYRITLTLDGGSVTGTAACNRYGGKVMIDGSFRIRLGAMTAMACRPDVMDAESAYMSAIGAAEKIAREDDTLVLTGNGTELRFELRPPIPTAELLDTRWRLEALISGRADDAVIASAEPAELLLKSDGTLTGSTGCRDLHGEWIRDGDEILFARFGAEGHCPSELQAQDGHVVGVLGDGFTVEIDGDQLTVFSRGGLGLAYRAAG